MEKVVVNSYEEFAQLLGKQIGVSDGVMLLNIVQMSLTPNADFNLWLFR